MKKGISACIIGKDEERNLHRCLGSVKDSVDEIIYLDTGSRDKSVDVAKSYGAKVFTDGFYDDFSKARNRCISYADYEWILIIDCDEELKRGSFDKLSEEIKRCRGEAFVLNIVNMVKGEAVDRLQSLRMFKNGEGYYFQGKIHEQVAPSIVKKCGVESLVAVDVTIFHHGYSFDKATEEKKHIRNLRILNSVEQGERNDYFYFNLGNEYGRVDDYKNAILNYEKGVKLIRCRELYTVLLYERLAHFYYLTGSYERAILTAIEGKSYYNSHVYFYYIMGLSYIEQMKFTLALKELTLAKSLLLNCEREKNYVPLGLGVTNKKAMYEAIEELKDCVISSKEGLLTTIIDCRGEIEVSEESIKSISEISSEIVVLRGEEGLKGAEDKVSYREAQGKSLIEAIRESKTSYILILKNNEGLSFEDQQRLYKEIEGEDKDYLFLYNIRKDKSEVRVVKKNGEKYLEKVVEGRVSFVEISYFK